MQDFAQWYQADLGRPYMEPAEEVYLEAVNIFRSRISRDARKIGLVEQAPCLEDIQCTVIDAKSRFELTHQNQKVGKWLSRLSSRINFYGNIMDVLVQHHPEYVALAWGGMKCLFVLVENHESTIRCLAKALCKLADALPRTKLATVLYPTTEMKQAVAQLYTNVLRFLIRAQDWYEEGRLLHMLHSLTRPVEIRFADIVEDVQKCADIVDSLAVASAQAEQRDMHSRVQEVLQRQKSSDRALLEMRQMMITHQAINSSAHLDTNQRLSDLQVSQLMESFSGACKLDAMKSLRYCAFMRSKHISRKSLRDRPFWITPKFRAWESANTSSLIWLKGTFNARFEIRDFCVNAISLLRQSQIPVVWALKSVPLDDLNMPSETDVLKDLVGQVLRLNIALQNERSLALKCSNFHTAETEIEWLELLGSLLATVPQIYIVVDLEAVGHRFANLDASFCWPLAFLDAFRKVAEFGSTTLIKVILVTYGSTHVAIDKRIQDLIVSVGRTEPMSSTKRGVKRASQGSLTSVAKVPRWRT